MHLSATTHKAARVLNELADGSFSKAGTVHSFLGLKLEWHQGRNRLVQDREATNKTDLLVVDETSMMSRELYSHIRSALVSERIKCVLFVGDPYQLPPISEGFLPFLEKTDATLTEVVRQEEGNPIIAQATQIREMIRQESEEIFRITPSDDGRIKVFRNIHDFFDDYFVNDDEKMILGFANKTVDTHNMRVRSALKPDSLEYEAGDTVIAQEVYEHEGAIVIANGEELKLVEAERQDDYWLLTDMSDRSFYTPAHNYKQILKAQLNTLYERKAWDDYAKLKRGFLELKYAYACTIHKSQGSTWGSVYIDLRWFPSDMSAEMRNRLTYVALTRARNSVCVLY